MEEIKPANIPAVDTLETELILRDSKEGLPVAEFKVGNLIPIQGVMFRVVKVAENRLELEVQGYTGSRIKKLLKQHQENERKKRKGKEKLCSEKSQDGLQP